MNNTDNNYSAPANPQQDNGTSYAPGNTAPLTPGNTAPFTPDNTAPHTPDNTAPHTSGNNAPFTPGNTAPFTPDNTAPFTPGTNAPFMPGNKAPFMPGNARPPQRPRKNYTVSIVLACVLLALDLVGIVFAGILLTKSRTVIAKEVSEAEPYVRAPYDVADPVEEAEPVDTIETVQEPAPEPEPVLRGFSKGEIYEAVNRASTDLRWLYYRLREEGKINANDHYFLESEYNYEEMVAGSFTTAAELKNYLLQDYDSDFIDRYFMANQGSTYGGGTWDERNGRLYFGYNWGMGWYDVDRTYFYVDDDGEGHYTVRYIVYPDTELIDDSVFRDCYEVMTLEERNGRLIVTGYTSHNEL